MSATLKKSSRRGSSPYRTNDSGEFPHSTGAIHRLTPEDISIKMRESQKCLHKQYIVGEMLGEGSYGKVKELLDTKTNKLCAVKILTKKKLRNIPGGEDSIRREIEFMKKIQNKYCTRFVDYWADDEKEKSYLVLEYVAGGSLHDLLDRAPHKRLPLKQAQKLFRQLIKAIEYIHSIGIVHRDIKPDNIMLTNCGSLKLSDFGVARFIDENLYIASCTASSVAPCSPSTPHSSLHASLNATGLMPSFQQQSHSHHGSSVNLQQTEETATQSQTPRVRSCGSPAFQPPEIASGSTTFSGPAQDVWAAGLVLYLMTVGRFPFETGNNVKALMQNISKCSFTLPEDMDPQLASLLRGMLEADPSKRLSVAQIKLHPWWNKRLKKETAVPVATPSTAFKKFICNSSSTSSNCTIC